MGGKRGGKGRRKKTSSNSNQQRNRHNDGSGNHPQHADGDDSRTQVKFANGGGGGGDNSNRGGMDPPDEHYSRSSRPVEECHQIIDPPPDHSGSRPSRGAAPYEEAYGSDPSKFEEGQLLRREQVLREVYSYSDESDADGDDNNNNDNEEYQQMQHDNGEPMLCYDEQQTLQDEHEQYNSNHNGDHSFTQFNIQPQFQQQQQQKPPKPKRKDQPKEPTTKRKSPKRNYSLSDMSDEEQEQDEEAPLFFSPSNNFDSATDNYTDKHAKGVGWGVDYLSERAHRKEKERKKHNFEMDEQRRKREKELWWWQGNDDDDDEYDNDNDHDNDPTSRSWDEIDFDDYHSPSFSSVCKCRMGRRRQRCVRNVVILFVGFIAIALAVAVAKDKALEAEEEVNRLALLQSGKNNTYGKPSSRWGHRFDDGTNQNKTLTPEQKEAELEKWEDFEMEAANVLADSSPGWDINSKTGGKVSEQEDNETLVDGYTDHWIQYYDKSSEAYYYYNRETNSTQWEKPEMNAGAVLLGVAYETGIEYVIEDGGIVEEIEGGGIGGGDIRSSVPLTTSEHPDHHEESTSPEINTEAEHAVEAMLASEMDEFTNAEEVLNHYKESYWRWNHPYRIPAGVSD